MRIKRFRAALLLTLIVALLIVPTVLTISLLSVSPASASPGLDENIVRAKDTAYNINQVGPLPWFVYEEGDRPLSVVAKRVEDGGVLAGPSSACRNGRWNDSDNPDPHYDILLDVAFQWMTGLEASQMSVLWYEGTYNVPGGHYVYNDSSTTSGKGCSQLVAALRALGYTVSTSSVYPITSSLLAPYDILIIAQMQEGDDGTGGDPTMIADEEVTAIKNFVEGGKGLAIMEASDFGGHNYNKVQNKILVGLGFDYYFQDDQVSDGTNNYGGAVYQIVTDVDTTTEIGAAYQARTGKTTIGLYSTCSLVEAGPGVSLYVLPDYQVGMPGATLEYTITVSNPENPLAEDLTYDIMVGDNADWSPSVSPTSLSILIGESKTATLTVTIPPDTPLSIEDEITVLVVARGYPEVRASFTGMAHAGMRIEPTNDTYVDTQENDANYNNENSLRIGRFFDFWQWDYLQFDLSEIPSNKNITDARLYLYAYYKYAGGFDVLCHEVDDDVWFEDLITWNDKPELGTILDTKFVDAASYDSPKSYYWNVTSFVANELAGDKKASFCLRPPDNLPDSISRAFWSKERYENRTHPFLRVSYTEVEEFLGVSVSISPSESSVPPGATLTYTVTVTNTGNVSDTYSLTTADNAGWSRSISPTTLSLAEGDSGTATLTVTIPSGAEHGTRDSITVTATSTVSDSASCTAQAVIARGVEVSISPTSGSGSLGEEVAFTVTVTNTGEAEDTYDLTVSDNADWGATISPTSLTVTADGSQTTTVSVTIPSDADDGDSTRITVTATSRGDPTKSHDATCIATAEAAAEGFPIIYPVVAVVVIVVIIAVVLIRKPF